MHLCHAYPSMNIFEKYNGWMISVATSAIGWVLTVDTHCGEVGTHWAVFGTHWVVSGTLEGDIGTLGMDIDAGSEMKTVSTVSESPTLTARTSENSIPSQRHEWHLAGGMRAF